MKTALLQILQSLQDLHDRPLIFSLPQNNSFLPLSSAPHTLYPDRVHGLPCDHSQTACLVMLQMQAWSALNSFFQNCVPLHGPSAQNRSDNGAVPSAFCQDLCLSLQIRSDSLLYRCLPSPGSPHRSSCLKMLPSFSHFPQYIHRSGTDSADR